VKSAFSFKIEESEPRGFVISEKEGHPADDPLSKIQRRAKDQKKKRADSCIWRLGCVPVILPKPDEEAKVAAVELGFAVTVRTPLGAWKFVWLMTLKTSTQN